MGQARRTISAPNPAPYEDVGGLRFLPRPLVDGDWTGDYHGPISAVTHDISPGREQIIGSGIGASPEGSNGSGPDGLARGILARVPSVRSWPAGGGRVMAGGSREGRRTWTGSTRTSSSASWPGSSWPTPSGCPAGPSRRRSQPRPRRRQARRRRDRPSRTRMPTSPRKPSPYERVGSAEINAMVERVAPSILELLGDGVPRPKAARVKALAGRRDKQDGLQARCPLAVTRQ